MAVDQPIAALIKDLKSRLLDTTTVFSGAVKPHSLGNQQAITIPNSGWREEALGWHHLPGHRRILLSGRGKQTTVHDLLRYTHLLGIDPFSSLPVWQEHA